MEVMRDSGRDSDRDVDERPPRQDDGAGAGVLGLQATAGNQAVGSVLGAHRASAREEVGATTSGPGATTTLDPQARALVDQFVHQQVSSLPDIDENVIPDGAEVEQVRSEGEAMGRELEEIGVRNNAPLAELLQKEAGDDLEPKPAPAPAGPGRWERFKAGVSGLGSSIGGGISSLGSSIKSGASRAGSAIKTSKVGKFFSRGWAAISGKKTAAAENDRKYWKDKGALAPVVGTVGVVGLKHSDQVLTGAKDVADNPGTTAAADALTGHHGQVSAAGSAVDAASSSDGLHVVAHVVPVLNLLVGGIRAMIDIRAVWRTGRSIWDLYETRKKAALDANHDPEVVKAIDYALRQKYQKLFKRSLSAAAGIAAIGVTIAVLASNPVGWGVLAALGLAFSLVGLAMAGWKLARKIYKTVKKTKGVTRGSVARLLFRKLQAGDPLARQAVINLHLDPDVVATDDSGVQLIERKLKST
ncbi:MAG TPA: hypothetical protein VFA11_14675 [Acidimicrobiales bacterium]|nr:hypothetical protein [Acidimicrobiales bacterium]